MLDFLKKMFGGSSGSVTFQFNATDFLKVMKDGGIVGIIAALGYYSAHTTDIVHAFGDGGVLLTGAVTAILSGMARFFKNNDVVPAEEVKEFK